jgi:hypothetical protein
VPRGSTHRVEWNGREVEARYKRAQGRATIGVGQAIAGHGKRFAHVESGDMRRSIHVAKHHTLGEQRATQANVQTRDGTVLDVGSWLDYACVEEVGRGHQFMQPAVEAVRPVVFITYRTAFQQEGF